MAPLPAMEKAEQARGTRFVSQYIGRDKGGEACWEGRGSGQNEVGWDIER